MLAATAISFAFFQFGNKNIANITVIYSLALILTALGTTGYWYGIAASLYCVTAVNYFFSYPYFHFNFSLAGYPITFIGMLTISLLTSTTTSTLKKQRQAMADREKALAEAEREKLRANLLRAVSHDLRTPLTSIINYVDLLRKQGLDSPHAPEYLEVLERKSHRLKKLTEDLVEASKASTGSLPVHLERLGMVQLLQQALGEWEERFVQSGLTAVPTYPAEEAWIMADGRHLWRVIDNLLSNCNKYALEGTRVYIEIFRGKGSVSLSVKNVSRDPLNVPPERLMERFVRGEESRTTEGSGLGLSIAKSLTELQGGTFELVVDGDLFKAIVTLPQSS